MNGRGDGLVFTSGKARAKRGLTAALSAICSSVVCKRRRRRRSAGCVGGGNNNCVDAAR